MLGILTEHLGYQLRNKIMNYKFTYGDSIVIKAEAPAEFNPGQFAEVCSMRTTKENINLYIVEFADGSDIEVPEEYLLFDREEEK